MFAIGKLKLKGANKIEVGGSEFHLNSFAYNDLYLLEKGVEGYKWVRTTERSFDWKIGGYYFKGTINKHIMAYNALYHNMKRILLSKNEKGKEKESVYFYLRDYDTVVMRLGQREHAIYSFDYFARIVRMMRFSEENMSRELWKRVKSINEGGTFAVLDRNDIPIENLTIWDKTIMLVEANDEETIYKELEKYLIDFI